jgi:hypothetical protein
MELMQTMMKMKTMTKTVTERDNSMNVPPRSPKKREQPKPEPALPAPPQLQRSCP